MTLFERLKKIPCPRDSGIPPGLKDIALVLHADQLRDIELALTALPGSALKKIVVSNVLQLNGFHDSGAPVSGLDGLQADPGLAHVCLPPKNDMHNNILMHIGQALSCAGIEKLYLLHQGQEPGGHYPPQPDFYTENSLALEDVYQGLADDKSRQVYTARVKALMTGDPGWLPIAAYSEYHHPLVRPEAGEIMIDGGVSDMVGAQKGFAEAVGERGMIFGFEPIPSMCASAKKSLADYRQYQMLCLGLGAEKGKFYFTDARDSSHFTDSADGAIECEVTDIDGFLTERKIRRLNCIKLDIEGAELAALQGAETTIKKLRPKLIICLYHKAVDLIEIPQYIKKIAPEYRLYVAHHSACFLDTVLYAHPPV